MRNNSMSLETKTMKEMNSGDAKETNKSQLYAVVPVCYEAKKLPPLEGTPDILIHGLYKKGLDNPTYYDPRSEKRLPERQRPKRYRDPLPMLCDTRPAKLTKIPGLRRWKLHFHKSRRSPTLKRIAAVLALSLSLLLLLSGIAVVVYISVRDGFDHGSHLLHMESQGSQKVESKFRITNRKFSSELQDLASAGYLRLAAEVLHSLDVLFMDSPLVTYYNTTDGIRFSNGSVIVFCHILLKHAVMNAAQQVGLVFVDAVEKGSGMLPPGILRVELQSVRFSVVKPGAEQPNFPKMLPNEENNASYAFWSTWMEWSLCLNTSGQCDPLKLQSRIRQCHHDNDHGTRTENPKCIGSDVEIRDCTCTEIESSSTTHLAVSFPPQLLSSFRSASWSEWGPWSSCTDISGGCDPRQIQRRIRSCRGSLGRYEPHALCARPGQRAAQIRLCICLPEEYFLSADVGETEDRGVTDDGVWLTQNTTIDESTIGAAVESVKSMVAVSLGITTHISCLPLNFTCNNGRCISKVFYCDGLSDCEDASDEPFGCISICSEHGRRICSDGRCISGINWCDGVVHCTDGTDEELCK